VLLCIHAKQFYDFLKVAASVLEVASQFKRLLKISVVNLVRPDCVLRQVFTFAP
jgi:hypothetical protein